MSAERIESADVIVWGEGSRFAQQIAVGPHRLNGDEPERVGGTGTGPSPYDFLLAALGSCTSMTVGMYARHKNWPLERVTVWLRHSKIYAADCAECETKEGMLDRIERDVRFDGPLNRRPTLSAAGDCQQVPSAPDAYFRNQHPNANRVNALFGATQRRRGAALTLRLARL